LGAELNFIFDAELETKLNTRFDTELDAAFNVNVNTGLDAILDAGVGWIVPRPTSSATFNSLFPWYPPPLSIAAGRLLLLPLVIFLASAPVDVSRSILEDVALVAKEGGQTRMPEEWQDMKMIMIPKPGKDHAAVKGWWPIQCWQIRWANLRRR